MRLVDWFYTVFLLLVVPGLVWAQTSYLMVSHYTGDAIAQFDLNTGSGDGEFVPVGQGGLSTASGVLSGSDGNFYVVSQGNNRVLVKDGENGSFLRAITTGSTPVGVLLSPTGTLLVVENIADRVSEFSLTTGSRIGTWNSGGGLNAPGPIVYGPDGNIYVGSRANDKVVRFNASTGAFIDNFVPAGSGGLDNPGDLAFVGDYLYVTSRNTNEVLRYNATTGAFEDVFVSSSVGLSDPIGILSLPDGNWLVASFGNNQVIEFSASGSLIGPFLTGMDVAFMTVHSYPAAPTNLLVNGSCEEDPLTNGWTQVSGNWQQALSGSSMRGNQGAYFFTAGAAAGTVELYQDVDVAADAVYIDAGSMDYHFQAYLRSFPQNPADAGRVIMEYRASDGTVLDTYDTNEQTNTAYWLKVMDERTAPAGTRVIRIRLLSTRYNGTNSNGHFDNLSLSKTITGAPLPVSWLYFTARSLDGEVKLEWATSVEENNAGFRVERSATGNHWEEIGALTAAQSTDGAKYSFSDVFPLPGRSYYRLRQTDQDGTVSFSTVVSVSRHAATKKWSVFPNPVRDELRVEGESLTNGNWQLYNANGKRCTVSWTITDHLLQLNLSDHPTGTYFLTDGQQTVKLLKVE